MPESDGLADLTAAQMVEGYSSGDVSPVEVAEAALGRIEAAEPFLHAMYLVYRDRALEAARASEKRWADGESLGPMDGVTATLKENVPVTGEPTPWGSAASIPVPSEVDAPVARRLFDSGAIVLGKTTMPEWGMLSSGLSTLHPTTRNAWNTDWNPGGSSAGAGAASAAGYAAVNFGSDIGGSVRLPASWNGGVGFKPSFGRIPVDPPYFGRSIGPMGRYIADLARVMPVVSGDDYHDPYSLPDEAIDWSDLTVDLSGKRVALQLDAGCGMPVDPEVAAAVRAAAELFERAGAVVEPLEPYFSQEMLDRLDLFWRIGHWNDFRKLPPERQELMLPFIAEWCRGGAGISGEDAAMSSDEQLRVAKATLAATQPYDLILSPVSPGPTYPAEWAMPSNDVNDPMAHIGFCVTYNMSGQPAASVNCGFTADDRPIGLQIAGRRLDDRGVLAAAAFYEAHRPDTAVRPWPRIWENPRP